MQLLEQTFGSKNSIKVLRQLAKHENWEFNITELARDININKGILSRLIKKLNENNIIKINKENTLIRNLIIPAFKIEDKLFDEFIKPRILKLKSKDLLSIILYGSYAKGDFKLTSDLDLLIIIKNKNDQLENEINKLKKEFLDQDLLVRVDIMTLKEFKRLYKLKEPLLVSIEKNHKILYGSNLNDLIK